MLWNIVFNLSKFIKPLTTLCWKTLFFQSKQPMTKWHHISLNSQFTVVLNGIICFSVWFCDNSLLVLKMRFQVFSLASKKVERFSSDRKTLMSLLSVLFHQPDRVSVFWNFNLQSRHLGKRSCPWNQSYFLRNSDKSLLSPQ